MLLLRIKESRRDVAETGDRNDRTGSSHKESGAWKWKDKDPDNSGSSKGSRADPLPTEEEV